MSLLRRRMMMQKLDDSEEILYPIQDGEFPFTDGVFINGKIENGIITAKSNVIMSYGKYYMINITDLSQNTTDSTSIDNVSNKPTLFSIPAGSSCKLTIGGSVPFPASYGNVHARLYKANANEIIEQCGLGNNSINPEKVEWVQESDVDAGCLAIVVHKASWNDIFSVTVTLEINGKRYI